ncbi:hypothetical protein [Candidatus Fokinia crypta]|uniref:Uncharacterized protein n=1 Tax=Candidatus Fokinia crypta TaxID=1920990 RepID=A0ABZ0URR7_9RICK|nr:hypothetical protein [Candidatus Fokinia cryptica]WPX97951.1 hypothetical protein Fokcrypt_00476 [Candidatus Fokinia cryptica]
MINKNNTNYNSAYVDVNVIRRDIQKYCNHISLYSVPFLEFIFHRNGEVSQEELAKKFPELVHSRAAYSIAGLCFTLEGKLDTLPEHFSNNGRISFIAQSITRPIFMEEAQMILQNQECVAPNNSSNLQHNQQAPSLEQTQYTITGDETRDSDNDLSDL